MSPSTSDRCPAVIAVDWGTTSCRFTLLSADGSTLDRRSGPGILPLLATDRGPTDRAAIFERSLRDLVGDWLRENSDIPVVMCGMVGSDRGWCDAGYRRAPVDLLPTAAELVPIPLHGHPAYLVPGVMQREPVPEVMRGEETQTLGALPGSLGEVEAGEALVVVPGTHSKWIRVSDGRILHFRTYMTGDLFAALTGHTILSSALEDQRARTASPLSDAFDRGIALALADERASLSRHLFRVRSDVVLGDLEPTEAHEFLSGLLIGDEVADAAEQLNPRRTGPIHLIASDPLADRYRAALERAGLSVHHADGDPAARGLHAIAQQLAESALHSGQERCCS